MHFPLSSSACYSHWVLSVCSMPRRPTHCWLQDIIILQNKIDLVNESAAINQHESIHKFIQGTIAGMAKTGMQQRERESEKV